MGGRVCKRPSRLRRSNKQGYNDWHVYRVQEAQRAESPNGSRPQNISDEDWQAVFKGLYWDRWKADDIKSQAVANILVDWVWASGVHGIKRPQRLLGVTADGIVGAKTIAALNAKDPAELFRMIKADRVKFIDEICAKRPENNRFKKGWLNRINAIKYE